MNTGLSTGLAYPFSAIDWDIFRDFGDRNEYDVIAPAAIGRILTKEPAICIMKEKNETDGVVFMEHPQIQNMVSIWYLNNPVRHSGALKDNKLFKMLYDSHCHRQNNGRSFEDVIREGSYLDACTELFVWYEKQYAGLFRMDSGTQGQKRTVTRNTTEYTFDLLYCDDRQFKSYLLTDTPLSGSQDLFAFVLHTAVAFLVSPQALDEVLQHLGFHPLHVKNVHHLAICYVLLAAENRQIEADYNPFAQVKALYLQAIDILNREMHQTAEGYFYGNQSTLVIREELFLQRELRMANFAQLIERNSGELNMRHSKILEDFHRLICVFLHIFDAPASEADTVELDGTSEFDYSFYTFIAQYCKDGLSRKKYREQVTGMIDRNGKHPTRNLLILLWLYAHCFCCLSDFQGVYIEPLAFNRILKQLKKWNSDWVKQAKAHYHNEYFDVFAFIMDSDRPTVSQDFHGADVIAAINERLLNRYGWGILNARLPFDYYILKLEKLVVHKDKAYCKIHALYDGQRISISNPNIENVPLPLVAISQLFTQLKAEIAKRSAFSNSANNSHCPLKCSLYEQL